MPAVRWIPKSMHNGRDEQTFLCSKYVIGRKGIDLSENEKRRKEEEMNDEDVKTTYFL